MSKLNFIAVRARQSSEHQVLSFSARASDILSFATIDRISRKEDGTVSGFQRPQVNGHINEIRDYLATDEAVLPNPIVIAFTGSVEVVEKSPGVVELIVDTSNGAPGLVVDGQQRLTALSGLLEKDFEVFVSALVCKNEDELRKQFILINNTKPLPKSLIYELLPTVEGLPDRMSSRALAAKLTETLNYDETSSLNGQIKQHTNPDGIIADTVVQKVVINSLADGACRELITEPDGREKCFQLLSDFYGAVQDIFADAWLNHKPKSSRLVHGAGITAMGYAMEYLYVRTGARTRADFASGLKPLLKYTAWTSGEWHFGDEVRPWNGLQNLHRDIQMLASFLTRVLKTAEREKIVELEAKRG